MAQNSKKLNWSTLDDSTQTEELNLRDLGSGFTESSGEQNRLNISILLDMGYALSQTFQEAVAGCEGLCF